MHYTSVEQRSRSADFDALKAMGALVLKDPRVMRGLGRITQELLAAWDSVFLPKVQHGVVSLPTGERFTNGFALLPLGENERHGELRLDASMYEPTRRRREAFHAAGGSHSELVRKAAECTTRWGTVSPNLSDRRPAETFFTGHTEPDTFVTTRPIIYAANSSVKYGPTIVGRLAAHETIHGMQGESITEAELAAMETDPEKMQLFAADAEFEAYCSGAVILEAGGYDPQRSDMIDFRVAALGDQQLDQEAFVREMIDLGVVPTIDTLVARV